MPWADTCRNYPYSMRSAIDLYVDLLLNAIGVTEAHASVPERRTRAVL
jgi:hypothetical protein